MKFLRLCLVILVVISCQSVAVGEEWKEEVTSEKVPAVQEDYSSVPSIVSDSLQLYREQGAEVFIKAILKGGPLEGDENSAKELERMRVVEKYYGRMQQHNFVNVLKMASFYKKIYVILQFEKGPVFCSVDCYYTSKNTWVVSAFVFDTDIVKVFPDILLKQYLESR